MINSKSEMIEKLNSPLRSDLVSKILLKRISFADISNKEIEDIDPDVFSFVCFVLNNYEQHHDEYYSNVDYDISYWPSSRTGHGFHETFEMRGKVPYLSKMIEEHQGEPDKLIELLKAFFIQTIKPLEAFGLSVEFYNDEYAGEDDVWHTGICVSING